MSRIRSRALDIPPGWNSYLPTPTEWMEDVNDRPMQFNYCLHTRTRAKTFEPLIVSTRDIFTGLWSGPIPASYPSTDHLGGVFGWFEEPIEFPNESHVFPPVDVTSIVQSWSRSETNLAEVIATFSDTIGLFTQPWRFIKHLRSTGFSMATHKGLKSLRPALDKAADTWLEGTYGYLPFISDLQNLANDCRNPSRVLKKPIPEKKVTLHHSKDFTISSRPFDDESTNSGPYQSGYNVGKVEAHYERTLVVRGRSNPTWDTYSTARKLAAFYGLNDYGKLAWELVPFSFVADWFTNLGAHFASLDALNGPVAYLYGGVERVVKSKHLYSYSAKVISPPDFRILSGGKYSYEVLRFLRDSPDAGDLLGLDNGLSARRTASGLALLWGSWSKLLSRHKF